MTSTALRLSSSARASACSSFIPVELRAARPGQRIRSALVGKVFLRSDRPLVETAHCAFQIFGHHCFHCVGGTINDRIVIRQLRAGHGPEHEVLALALVGRTSDPDAYTDEIDTRFRGDRAYPAITRIAAAALDAESTGFEVEIVVENYQPLDRDLVVAEHRGNSFAA